MATHGLGRLLRVVRANPQEPVLFRPQRTGLGEVDSPTGEWVRVAVFKWEPEDSVDYAVRLTVTASLDAGASGDLRARVAGVSRATTPMSVTYNEDQEAINRPLPWLTLGIGPQTVWLEARITSGDASGGMRIIRADGNTAPSEVVGTEPMPAAGSAVARLGNLHAKANINVLGGVIVAPSGDVANVIAPVILGTPTANSELLADPGLWENASTLEYQWEEETALVTVGLSGSADLGGLTASAQLTFQDPAVAFALVASASMPDSTANARSFTLPNTVQAGDLIEVYVASYAQGDPGAPNGTGFTSLYSFRHNSQYRPRTSLLYRIATAGDAGTTKTINTMPSIAHHSVMGWAVWRGIDSTNPYRGAPVALSTTFTMVSGSYDPPAVSVVAGDIVMTHISVQNTTPGISQAIGYTRFIHEGPPSGMINHAVQYKVVPQGATTEDPPPSTGDSHMHDAITRVLRPLSVVAPPPQPTVPSAPSIGNVSAGDAQATVGWTAPTSDGGSPLTSYSIQVLTGTTVVRTDTGLPTTPLTRTVTGLTNGTAYNFKVIAVNAVGSSAPSAASSVVTPTAPTQPPPGNGNLPHNMLRPSYVPASATRIFYNDFSTAINASTGPFKTEMAASDRIRIASQGGDNRARIELRPGDTWSGPGQRSEMKTYNNENDKGPIDLLIGRHWVVYDVMYAPGYISATSNLTAAGDWPLTMQYQGPRVTGGYPGPVLSTRTASGNVQVVHQNYMGADHLPGVIQAATHKLVEGEWNRWGFETLLTQSGGMIRIWRNGVLLYTLPTSVPANKSGHRKWLGLKLGIYHAGKSTAVAWVDNVQIFKA